MTNRTEQVDDLLAFIQASPTAFHAVDETVKRLKEHGFVGLSEADEWELKHGGCYYVTRNRSSLIAFRIPQQSPARFLIAATHTDSPMLKLKPSCEQTVQGCYHRLATEVYGGTILASWLDRPLSIAGRVVIEENGHFVSRTVSFDRDLCLIPSLAIHFNREVNKGVPLNPAVDMLPLLSLDPDAKKTLFPLLAKELGCEETQICDADLFAVCRTKGSVWGANDEFFSAPRIDDLMCVHGTLTGFLAASPAPDSVTVLFAADNEEVGSHTKQGAASSLLSDTLERITQAFDRDTRRMLASSMMVSADNAHAKHPNHPELSDAENAPVLGGGVVIKYNASQKYTTDALSASLFERICRSAGVPVQRYANRSDLAGGSTLGSISNTRVSLLTVDVGMAQLAMHAAVETAACADVEHLAFATQHFFEISLAVTEDGTCQLTLPQQAGKRNN